MVKKQSMNSPVLFELHQVSNDKYISHIKLNLPKSLNALTLQMVDLLQEHLDCMRENKHVVALILDSSIEKAFCAGGDVVSITKAWSEGDEQLAKDFFQREYQLDYNIHHYPKPIICLANGIVMGGGMGLMNGCSHRVVTDTTHMAMPELSIGLFPDVGGSKFLNEAPSGAGLFLGLTAAPFNGADAIYLGMADYIISSAYRTEIVPLLHNADWCCPAEEVINKVLIELQERSAAQCKQIESNCVKHQVFISEATQQGSLPKIIHTIINQDSDCQWLQRAQHNLKYGSPTSAYLIHQQLMRTNGMNLEDIFTFEYNLAITCCSQGDFIEGVRALLIDKDRKPNWKYSTSETVDEEFINSFFI